MKKKEIFAIALNVAIIVMEIVALVIRQDFPHNMFCFYTIDSNILCLIGSTLFVLFMLIKKSQKEVPSIVMFIRYASTACLIVTFIVVVTILSIGNIDGVTNGTYFDNLILLTTKDSFLYHHLLCPIVSFVSFIFFEGDRRLNKKKTIWLAVLPTIIYGVVLIILNVLRMIEGPYPFLMVYAQPIYMTIIYIVGILIGDYFISRFILLFNQMHASRR